MRAIGALLIILFAAHGAAAETAEETARALNRRAMSQYDLGHYDEAARLFERAYEKFAEPKILFNLAQTYRKQRNYQAALASYRSYLRNLPGAANRAVVEERIDEIQKILDAQKASDEKPPEGVTPAPVPIAPKSPSPAPAVKRTENHWYQDKWGWALAGGGVAAAAVGVGFELHASGLRSDYSASAESARERLRSNIRRDQWIGGIGLGLGAALVSAAAVKFALFERAHPYTEVSAVFLGSEIVVAGAF